MCSAIFSAEQRTRKTRSGRFRDSRSRPDLLLVPKRVAIPKPLRCFPERNKNSPHVEGSRNEATFRLSLCALPAWNESSDRTRSTAIYYDRNSSSSLAHGAFHRPSPLACFLAACIKFRNSSGASFKCRRLDIWFSPLGGSPDASGVDRLIQQRPAVGSSSAAECHDASPANGWPVSTPEVNHPVKGPQLLVSVARRGSSIVTTCSRCFPVLAEPNLGAD